MIKEERGEHYQQKTKILIVDDNPTNIDLLRRFLEDHHYIISAVTSGEVALKLIEKSLPDIILLDVMMPGIDGHETCRRLKLKSETKNIPIIFVTAKISPEDIREGFRLGAADYITKPAQREEVLARVQNQISLFRQKNMEQHIRFKSQKMADLGDMVSHISHQVYTPLGELSTSISVAIDNLREITQNYAMAQLSKNELNEFFSLQKAILQRSQMDIDKAKKIISTFKMIAVDQCSEKPRRINLKQYVENIIFSLSAKFNNCSHQIEVIIDPMFEIYSYPGALSQILINLINNALLHAFDGMDNGLIMVTALLLDEKVHLSVKDNGHGISEQNMAHIFDEYFTTNQQQGASGLGLNMIKHLTKNKLHGVVEVTSSSIKGSCFDIIFPYKYKAEIPEIN